METELATKPRCTFKKLDDKVLLKEREREREREREEEEKKKKKITSVNFCSAVFSLLIP
jgi:hypothetical protein